MRLNIFSKLLLTLIVTFSALLIVLLLVINWSFRQGFSDFLWQKDLNSSAAVVTSLQSFYQRHNSWKSIRNNPRQWAQMLRDSSASLDFSPPAARRPPPPPPRGANIGPPPPKPPRGQAPARPNSGQQSLAERLILTDKNRAMVFGPPQQRRVKQWLEIKLEDNKIGWLGVIPLALETDSLAGSFVEQQVNKVAIFSLLALVLIALVSATLARVFTRPINQVANAAAKLATGNLNISVPVNGEDELAQLSKNFNQMAIKLRRNDTLRKQWISDISHELRTPIAVLSAEIEAIRDGIRQPSPQRMESLYVDVQNLTALVDDLHQLSMADQGVVQLVCSNLDMRQLCAEQQQLFSARMISRGLELKLQVAQGQQYDIYADRHKLAQLLTNLLENSLRYTDAGGETVVALSAQQDFLKLVVQDSAPNVADADLTQIFQRLYRVDKSRTSASGGSGLGLAICQSIVEQHNGKISAAQSSLGGLAITVLLPLKTNNSNSLSQTNSG
ncbi:MAG: hypothetical protein OFPI_08530 [Osedax symbiont Rs2]|nr:MAG: hypothetical protein OFPI_08530 [Osedax symbiont Rs2]